MTQFTQPRSFSRTLFVLDTILYIFSKLDFFSHSTRFARYITGAFFSLCSQSGLGCLVCSFANRVPNSWPLLQHSSGSWTKLQRKSVAGFLYPTEMLHIDWEGLVGASGWLMVHCGGGGGACLLCLLEDGISTVRDLTTL